MAGDISLGTAYVTITATTKGMVTDINRALNGSTAVAGAAAGQAVGDGLEKGTKSGVSRASKAMSALKPVGVAIGGALVTGITAATGALIGMGKQAVSAYADFEQLAGGTELLFGSASEYIMQASEEAFRTVQMSQNDYLQQVNGFAVGLKTALGGDEQAAAELATRIIQAEADIAASTGVSSERIQDAFNGIMKGNYQMLDNLQIGIAPSKEGFQQMIDAVNAWNAAQGRATEYTIENLADCQAALIDYVEMQGLSGYAAKEAAGTITGSVSMMQAAYQNFLTSLGTGDYEKAVSNLVESVSGVLENIMPLITTIIKAIGEALPPLLRTLVPALVEAVTQLLLTVADMLPELMPIIIEAAVQLFHALVQAVPMVFDSLVEAIFTLMGSVFQQLPALIPDLFNAALFTFTAIPRAIYDVIGLVNQSIGDMLSNAVSGVINGVGQMLEAGAQLIGGLLDGVKQRFAPVLEFFGGILGKIKQALGNPGQFLVDAGRAVIDGFLNGLQSAFTGVASFIMDIPGWIIEHKGPPAYDATMLIDNGLLTMQGYGKGLTGGFDRYVTDAIDDINAQTKRMFAEPLSKSVDGVVSWRGAGDWRNIAGEQPVIIFNDAVLNDDMEMRQSALALLKDIRRAAVQ